MAREIRKLRDLGNGSGGVTIPRDWLHDMGLIDDDDELADEHLVVERDEEDDRVQVGPISGD